MFMRLYENALAAGVRRLGGCRTSLPVEKSWVLGPTASRPFSPRGLLVSLLSAATIAFLAGETSIAYADVHDDAKPNVVDDQERATGAAAALSPTPSIPVDKLACHRLDGRGCDASQQPVILVACGSFNPPTVAHVHLLSIVCDYYLRRNIDVYGAYMSPVHDEYKKPGLVSSEHRVAMCRLAAEGTGFVMVDDWEAGREGYTRTLRVLDSVDARVRDEMGVVHEALGGEVGTTRVDAPPHPLVPRSVLVCGADVLASMAEPGVWDQGLLDELLERHGVACVVREGTDAREVCGEEEGLVGRWWRAGRVDIVDVSEDAGDVGVAGVVDICGVSSSGVREVVRRGGGVGAVRGQLEGVVDERVLDYIQEHGLYTS